MKRALCLWLPNWPLQRLAAARAELEAVDHSRCSAAQAVVLYELHASGAARVVAHAPQLSLAAAVPWNVDPRRTAGIRAGMPLAEATALGAHAEEAHARQSERQQKNARPPAPSRLTWELYDPLADRVAIEELAEWCSRFSPIVGIEEAQPPESLLLDVTGLGSLVGGETELAQQVVRAFQERRLAVRAALADTPGAAWAVAHFAPLPLAGEEPSGTVPILRCLGSKTGLSPSLRPDDPLAAILSAVQVPIVVPPGQTWQAIAPLDVQALRLAEPTCALLAELGLRRIEQVAALPRSTLLARFGPGVLARLDQALGAAPEAIVARTPANPWEYEWPFEYPTARQEMIEFALARLAGRLCQALARERQGALRLQCRFESETGPASSFVVGMYRPSASEKHVSELLRLKLESLRFREPVSAIRLTALAIDRLEFQQQEMFAAAPSPPTDDDNVSLKLYQPNGSLLAPGPVASASCGTGSASVDVSNRITLAEPVPHGALPQREHARELAILVDRLSNRLGAHGVVRPWLLASAQPEFTCHYKPLASLAARKTGRAARRSTSTNTTTRISGDRPLLLETHPLRLSAVSVVPEGPPVQFHTAGRQERIVRVWGPERIETSWWRTRCVRRDYYQVETDHGARFWLFRELNTGGWYLHGAFA